MEFIHWVGVGVKLSKKSSSSFVFNILLTICILLTIPCLVSRYGLTAKVYDPPDLPLQGMQKSSSTELEAIRLAATTTMRRRMLVGPGSSPPRCARKCERCTPCRPIHVPVPPGVRVTTEYYPEAWRCKCGNKLYMP